MISVRITSVDKRYDFLVSQSNLTTPLGYGQYPMAFDDGVITASIITTRKSKRNNFTFDIGIDKWMIQMNDLYKTKSPLSNCCSV